MYFSSQITERMLQRVMGSGKEIALSPVDQLSDRELEVFKFIGEGLTTRRIAAHLHLSAKTIESHREHIKKDLGLKSGGTYPLCRAVGCGESLMSSLISPA